MHRFGAQWQESEGVSFCSSEFQPSCLLLASFKYESAYLPGELTAGYNVSNMTSSCYLSSKNWYSHPI